MKFPAGLQAACVVAIAVVASGVTSPWASAQSPLSYFQGESRPDVPGKTAPPADDDGPFADDPLPEDPGESSVDPDSAPQTPDEPAAPAPEAPARPLDPRETLGEPDDLSAANYLQDPLSTPGFPAIGAVRDPRLAPVEDEPFSQNAMSFRGPSAARPFGNSIGGPGGLYGRAAPPGPACSQFARNFAPRRFPLCRTWLSWEPCDDSCCDECSGHGERYREGAEQLAHFQTACRGHYVTIEGVALRRDTDEKFLAARVGPGGAAALSSSAVCFPYAGGGQITLGRFLSDRYAIELHYRGYFHWQGFDAVRDTTANSFGGVGNLSSPYTNFGAPEVAGFDGASLVRLDGVAHHQNYEINARYRLETCCGPIQAWWLTGVRYLDIREGLTHTWVTDRPLPGATSSVRSYARNQIVGPQIGMQVMYLMTPRTWVEFDGKAGVGGNQIFVDRTFVTTPTGGVAATTAFNGKRNATAVFGDVKVTGAHAVCSGFVVRAGYQATFVGDIATGATNMPPDVATLQNGPLRIRANATNIYHGPVLGGTIVW